ncbi:MAG: HD domain-containing protein [Planctomycetaceae bacterium]|nr:HD domain-containing protein [Planctomycetaceae bacterium]
MTSNSKLTIDAARELLAEWTPGQALRRHARAVELTMRKLAAELSPPDEELFAVAGLLHDADYEQWPDEHPHRIVAWLRNRQEDLLAGAIAAHYTHWGVPADTLVAKALLAADELTGFVCACSYVRPGGISTLEPASVLKKLKDKKFAAKVDRQEIEIGCGLLGVDTRQLVQWIIHALAPHAVELGIEGT